MRKKFLIILLLLFIISGFIGYKLYNSIFSAKVNLDEDHIVLNVPSKMDFQDLIYSLDKNKIVSDTSSFKLVSKLMKFKSPKPGRYKIENGWSNKDLITHLRLGAQDAVKLTFNNVRNFQELCGVFGKNLEYDSLDYLNHLKSNEFQLEHNVNDSTVLSLFIPNTYEVYWNSTPKKLFQRLISEHEKFWTPKRTQALEDVQLSKIEAYTLASIVQKESNLNSEKPRLAGVYINRLKKGMLLQADPTVVYAVGDFTIRRVLNRHLEFDSPYNTYKYEGLPPGPICMPDVSSLDAVIFAEDHNYLYFCANTKNDGSHLFAKSLAQHNRNAAKFHKWLNKQKIFK